MGVVFVYKNGTVTPKSQAGNLCSAQHLAVLVSTPRGWQVDVNLEGWSPPQRGSVKVLSDQKHATCVSLRVALPSCGWLEAYAVGHWSQTLALLFLLLEFPQLTSRSKGLLSLGWKR